MPNAPIKKPNYEYQWKMSIRDELRALAAFLRFHWQWVLLVAIGLGVFLHEIRPFPPRTVTIPQGSPIPPMKTSEIGTSSTSHSMVSR